MSAPTYLILGRRMTPSDPGFAQALAEAHELHHRPQCLCTPQGSEMYVARLGDTCVAKRMPGTGSRHAPYCPSHEAPADATGLGQLLGTAITEDPTTGKTTLKLGFTLSKVSGRTGTPAAGAGANSVASDGTSLSLRSLLHYLWDQAELTHWQPGFAGKRSWATVRRHLLQAAQHKVVRGDSLAASLFVPEIFSVDQRDAIQARRAVQWVQAMPSPGKPQRLLVLIAEVKEIAPARFGHKAVVKHLPDQPFALDDQLYRRMARRFALELALWGATDQLHLVMIATFGLSAAGLPTIAELSLMPVTHQWIPVEHAFELQLIETLVREGRAFIKGLRFNLDQGRWMACATLTDVGERAVELSIAPPGSQDQVGTQAISPESPSADNPAWTWRPDEGAMPPLPRPRRSTLATEQAN
jgi:hypothetical protein